MDFWIKAAQLILSLSILVVLHEDSGKPLVKCTKMQEFAWNFENIFRVTTSEPPQWKWQPLPDPDPVIPFPLQKYPIYTSVYTVYLYTTFCATGLLK